MMYFPCMFLCALSICCYLHQHIKTMSHPGAPSLEHFGLSSLILPAYSQLLGIFSSKWGGSSEVKRKANQGTEAFSRGW